MKLFSNLTREDAAALYKLDNGYDPEYRRKQVKQLEELLISKRGYTYYEGATLEMLKALVPYGFVLNARLTNEYPECVKQAYKVMFNAFDEAIKELIGDHYELQGWDDPLGEVIWCEDHLDEQEAIDAYNEVVADGEKYVFLRKVDKEGMPIEDILCNF